jgi:hypothetical protein
MAAFDNFGLEKQASAFSSSLTIFRDLRQARVGYFERAMYGNCNNLQIFVHNPGNTVVKQSTHRPKIEGLNPATSTGKDKKSKITFADLTQFRGKLPIFSIKIFLFIK